MPPWLARAFRGPAESTAGSPALRVGSCLRTATRNGNSGSPQARRGHPDRRRAAPQGAALSREPGRPSRPGRATCAASRAAGSRRPGYSGAGAGGREVVGFAPAQAASFLPQGAGRRTSRFCSSARPSRSPARRSAARDRRRAWRSGCGFWDRRHSRKATLFGVFCMRRPGRRGQCLQKTITGVTFC